jgi:hypothetical protein
VLLFSSLVAAAMLGNGRATTSTSYVRVCLTASSDGVPSAPVCSFSGRLCDAGWTGRRSSWRCMLHLVSEALELLDRHQPCLVPGTSRLSIERISNSADNLAHNHVMGYVRGRNAIFGGPEPLNSAGESEAPDPDWRSTSSISVSFATSPTPKKHLFVISSIRKVATSSIVVVASSTPVARS